MPADMELLLQKVVTLIVAAHLACSVASAVVAQKSGRSPLLPAVKVRASGSTRGHAFFEVYISVTCTQR